MLTFSRFSVEFTSTLKIPPHPAAPSELFIFAISRFFIVIVFPSDMLKKRWHSDGTSSLSSYPKIIGRASTLSSPTNVTLQGIDID